MPMPPRPRTRRMRNPPSRPRSPGLSDGWRRSGSAGDPIGTGVVGEVSPAPVPFMGMVAWTGSGDGWSAGPWVERGEGMGGRGQGSAEVYVADSAPVESSAGAKIPNAPIKEATDPLRALESRL